MLTDFQNSFTDRHSGKFAANSYLTSHHTLTKSLHYNVYESLCSKNNHAPEEIEANCHVRLSHSKISCKVVVW